MVEMALAKASRNGKLLAMNPQKAFLCVHVLIQDGMKVFMLRRQNTGYEDGNFTVVAGHVQDSEPVLAAAVREVTEETGVRVLASDLKYIGTVHRHSPSRSSIDLFFVLKKWEGLLRNANATRCDLAEWHTTASLPPNTIGYVREAIECLESSGGFLAVKEKK